MRQEVGYVVGTPPDWLPLGDSILHEGLPALPVLGDWSHLNECDQPPRFLRDASKVHNALSGWDRSENRPFVKQNRPGKPIGELRGKQSGKCVILFNGSSMHQHDLHKIKVPIIGMNRTHEGFEGYKGPQTDYLCIVDWAWFDRPLWRRTVMNHPCIINGSDHREEIGYRVVRHPRMSPFSMDIERDGYAGPIPCTTGHLALQLAVFLGFTEIHCIGWDLGGKHFDGTNASPWFNDAIRYHARQAPLLEEKGINVFVCGSPESRVKGFRHSAFEDAC
jgi:hypothetical protein